MDKQELITKIIEKKEFSKLPLRDIETAFEQFDKEKYIDDEKIKLTRDLLRRTFSVFTSEKLLRIKNYTSEQVLKKHVSTRERFSYYEEIYKEILEDFNLRDKINVFDFGAGVNGFSYNYFNNIGYRVNYFGVEAIGQLVDLTNYYFRKNNLNAQAIHLSLFELNKIRELIKVQKGKKIIFLFKTLDSLEILKRNYSKKFLLTVVPLVDEVVISFATKSLIKKVNFKANRKWILEFIKTNFKILEEFEFGGEKYIVFCKAFINKN